MRNRSLTEAQAIKLLAAAATRWLTKDEILFLLLHAKFLECISIISDSVKQRPQSGQILFYDASERSDYKKDGWTWQTRKDRSGRVREDRAKLVVNRHTVILGSYVHSPKNSTFHRRCYCIRDHQQIVLVHYLDLTHKERLRNEKCILERNEQPNGRYSALQATEAGIPDLTSIFTDEHEEQHVKNECRGSNGLEISDFSPEWDFVSGGAKVLICMAHQVPILAEIASIFVQFGPYGSVPAQILTPTVLRCTAPQATAAGTVDLFIYCANNAIVSEKRAFEYKLANTLEPIEYIGEKRGRSLETKPKTNLETLLADTEPWMLASFAENAFDERQCKIRVVERLSEFQQAIHNNSVNKADTAAETVMDDFVDVCNKDLTFDDRAADEMTDKEIEIYSEMLLERVLEQLVRIAHTDEELMEELNCVDETGLSLLHYVCFYKYARFVPFLVAHGAQVNQQSTQGQTALHIAAGCGHQDVVQVLLEYQVDLFVYDHLGLTAADRAESAGHFDVALQLRQLMTISAGDGIQDCQDNGFAESNALVGERDRDNRKFLLGAFSIMSLHDKCALSLGMIRDPDVLCNSDSSKNPTKEWMTSDAYSDVESCTKSSSTWLPTRSRPEFCDVKSVIADDEGKHKLVAAMELMDPEELQCLEEEARVIQHNVRAWLLKRNYHRMRDTTQKLDEVAQSIEKERRGQTPRCNIVSDARYPLSNSSDTEVFERAAVTVQAATRTMIARKNFLQAKNVTIKVQAATRGALCRKKFARMKRQALASLVIQRNVREWWNKQPVPSH
ncbi:unnamed protein product [Albugo candida]|uniref:CG-1 domain-containing protein n=1 Tax=Albugo candida TaxID=65357 RepID=A0A024GEC8_9STRA|nr:unnamed protein product [Albugo candida]|eukprot:CCI44865.1 unnamed protein product [Albugo candida]